MATDTSKKSGDWSSSSTWNHGVPTSTSDVVIAKNTDVTLTGGATVDALQVNANGVLDIVGQDLNVTAGITDKGEIIGSGQIHGDILGKGSVVAHGGVLDLSGSVNANNQKMALKIDSGATLKLDGAVGAPGSLFDGTSKTTVSFTGNGVLDLTGEGRGASGEEAKFQATVSHFAAGDQIRVAGAAGDAVHYNAGAHLLTVTDQNGAIQEEIKLSGNFKGSAFSLSHDDVTGADTITLHAICFMAGTMIRTPGGEVAVEALKRGDLVVTTDGIVKPVAWLGRQTIHTVFADPVRVWPIRIKAGAIAENVPSRDLMLSPDHAILIEGALIHAGALVNGVSIVRETTVPRVFTYYHVELDDHSLVLAENVPAETFMDNAERFAFDNWAEHEALYPEGKEMEELPYARAKAPRQTPVRVRVLLADRAHKLGLTIKALSA